MFKYRRLKKYIKSKYNVKIGHWHKKFYFILNDKYKDMVFSSLENIINYLEQEVNCDE